MDKKEYIVNQLKRTFNKKYENYCITRIYHLINRLDVQIVTQQLFRRSKNNIALADLYFPQLNLVIEIDEHHEKQIEEDKLRTYEMIKNDEFIKNKLKNLEEVIATPLEVIRIITNNTETIETINKQIDSVVSLINKRINELGNKFVPWSAVYKEPSYFINKKTISVNENAKFKTSYEVSQLFNKGYKKGSQKVYFSDIKNSKNYVWCPVLKIEIDDCKNLPYDNEISDDGNYIYEVSKENNDMFVEKVIDSIEERYVFAKYKDETGEKSYKFIGVYCLDKELTKKINKRAWKRIDKTLDLSKYFK